MLQDKTYEPLGSIKSERANVRIVAATNKDLEQLVAEGKFRQDLYYRINVVKLVLPPLRERKEDIPLLVDHFVRKYNRLNGKDIQCLSPDAFPMLMAYDFPGNIRELENIIEYASVVCKDAMIRMEHLPDTLHSRDQGNDPSSPDSRSKSASNWQDLERTYILQALHQNNWQRSATAKQLGVHPSTLWRKMKRLNLSPSTPGPRNFQQNHDQ